MIYRFKSRKELIGAKGMFLLRRITGDGESCLDGDALRRKKLKRQIEKIMEVTG